MTKQEERLNSLAEDFRPTVKMLLEKVSEVTGLQWGIVQAKRSHAYQHSLYMRPFDGKDNDGDGKIDEKDEKVTNADAGQSPHEFAYAVDLAPIKNGDFWWGAPLKYWVAMGELAERMGLIWGGRFKSIDDKPHVESPRWKSAQAAWRAAGSPLNA